MPTNDYSQRRNGGLSRMRVRLPVPLPVSLVRPNQNLISRFELLPLSWCRDRKDLRQDRIHQRLPEDLWMALWTVS
jgi:hypothetical protein